MRATLQGRGLQLVGEAGDGHQTLALAVDTEPDVVVLDLGMPGADGPDLIAELRRRLPAVRVVALSPFAGSEPPGQAGERGAHATLGKDVDPRPAAGDRARGVRAGLRAGRPCGNSGNSTEPHLHFQLQDHPSVLFAAGLPFRLARFEVDGTPEAGVPANGQPFTAAAPGRELEDRRQR